MGSVEETVLQLVREACVAPSPTLRRDTPIQEAGITSLDLVDIIFTLEERYGIKVPYAPNVDDHGMATVGDLIGLVENLVAGGQRAESAGGAHG